MWNLNNKRKSKVLFVFAIFAFFTGTLFLTSPLLISWARADEIFEIQDFVSKNDGCDEERDEDAVAIVFGAGLKNDGSPSDALKDRLIVAGELYQAGLITKILVSGDNRYENYNEPDSMAKYLIEKYNIPDEDISEDYAGRSTYETCARARNIWGIEKAILVTQEFHLPRAIFTCESFGIDSVGVSASLQDYVFNKYYKAREVLATYKAILDISLLHPGFVNGENESL